MPTKSPHHAKSTKKHRKYFRNRIDRKAGLPTKYRQRGTREVNKARRAEKVKNRLAKALKRRLAKKRGS